MADGMSFRGCLSGGGDIFSKSVEKQGGANRTFATGGRCHGWQLEPCPCGLEPLLTFRQKIPTGRPTPRKDVPSAMGVRGFVSLTLNLLNQIIAHNLLLYLRISLRLQIISQISNSLIHCFRNDLR